MRKLFLLLFTIAIVNPELQAQNVAINNDGSQPDAAAMLDIKSSSKGLLLPRMTQAQRTAINPAPQGLIVFQTDGVSGLYYNASSLPGIQNWYHLIQAGEQYWTKTLSGDNLYNITTGQSASAHQLLVISWM